MVLAMVIWFCHEVEWEEEKEFLLRGRLARVDQEFVHVCVLNGAFCSNVTHRVQATVGA